MLHVFLILHWQEDVIAPQPEIFNFWLVKFDHVYISIYKSKLLFPLSTVVKCIFPEPPVC